jgi:rhodanese-related sulfurtransferase
MVCRAIVAALVAATPLAAEPVMLRPGEPSVTVPTADGPFVIEREQDNAAVIEGEWAQVARPCPPFCIQPMTPAEGVETIGELELLDVLQNEEVLVLDSRTHDWWKDGTIPGAESLPWNQVVDRLSELGCEPDFEGWDCSEARQVVLFCNGLWCGQSPTAIRAMIAEGYPPERIRYYRGGMQSWRLLGLPVMQPQSG